jgi:apolipoprotein D and lipocalin family protein
VNKGFALTCLLLFTYTLSRGEDKDHRPLQAVSSLDLPRYTGKWYEIARLPNKFQKDCAADVVATYALLEGGQLKVVNQCRRENGQINQAEGRARLASKSGPNSKLKVRFAPSWLSWLPRVWGDYWVIELAEDYSHSVVGTPDRNYLWILSRTPQMEEEKYKRVIEKAAAAGFDVARVMRTRQAS